MSSDASKEKSKEKKEKKDKEGPSEDQMPDEDQTRQSSLEDKIVELEDAKLRMVAELQNTRKRLVKQHEEAYRYRHQDIISDLAEVIDNLNRAIESSVESRDFDTLYEGIVMIEKQMLGMLTEKYHLERIGQEGEAFDPSAHEAIMMESSNEIEVDIVKQLFQVGYRLYDRVLRPAKVLVLKAEQQCSASEDDQSENDQEEDKGE